jgi:hypothetical protein
MNNINMPLLWEVSTESGKLNETVILGKYYGTIEELVLLLSSHCKKTLIFTLIEGESNVDIKDISKFKNELYIKVQNKKGKVLLTNKYLNYLNEDCGMRVKDAQEKGIHVLILDEEIKKFKTELLLQTMDQSDLELLEEHFKQK